MTIDPRAPSYGTSANGYRVDRGVERSVTAAGGRGEQAGINAAYGDNGTYGYSNQSSFSREREWARQFIHSPAPALPNLALGKPVNIAGETVSSNGGGATYGRGSELVRLVGGPIDPAHPPSQLTIGYKFDAAGQEQKVKLTRGDDGKYSYDFTDENLRDRTVTLALDDKGTVSQLTIIDRDQGQTDEFSYTAP
jgi:hypothetical protein